MEKTPKIDENKKILKYLTQLTHLAFIMLAPILLCILGGHWLDEKFGVNPLFLAVGSILGIATAFKNLYDSTKKFWK